MLDLLETEVSFRHFGQIGFIGFIGSIALTGPG